MPSVEKGVDRVTAAVVQQGRTGVVGIVGDRQLCVAAIAALLVPAYHPSMLGSSRGFGPSSTMLMQLRPHVLVSDGGIGTRFDLTPWGGRLLVLLDPDDGEEVFREAARADADGYLARSASRDALRFAIEALGRVGYYLDPLLASRIVHAAADAEMEGARSEPRLTPREREIVSRVALGYSSKEIARDYSLTAKTVCNHISNIYEKLKLSHRGQLVIYATQNGLVRGGSDNAVPAELLARFT